MKNISYCSDWKKRTLENENPAFCIGFELEVENTEHTCSNNELARFVKNTYPVICSRDGSIDDGFIDDYATVYDENYEFVY